MPPAIGTPAKARRSTPSNPFTKSANRFTVSRLIARGYAQRAPLHSPAAVVPQAVLTMAMKTTAYVPKFPSASLPRGLTRHKTSSALPGKSREMAASSAMIVPNAKKMLSAVTPAGRPKHSLSFHLFLVCRTPRISCGVRAPALLAVRERAARRQLNALVGPHSETISMKRRCNRASTRYRQCRATHLACRRFCLDCHRETVVQS
jgi:hypothetical protein